MKKRIGEEEYKRIQNLIFQFEDNIMFDHVLHCFTLIYQNHFWDSKMKETACMK